MKSFKKKTAHCTKHTDDYQRLIQYIYPFGDYVQEKWKKMPKKIAKHLKYSEKNNKPKGIIGKIFILCWPQFLHSDEYGYGKLPIDSVFGIFFFYENFTRQFTVFFFCLRAKFAT